MDAVPDPDGTDALLAGRYDVGPLVGLGGTAQVYRAWDHEDGCPVAVKIFRPGSAPGPGYGGARELTVLTGVRHRGLVGMRGAGVDPQGCPFVVMDLVDGESLSARLHDGPMDSAAVARLGTVLAGALAVVHARGVVHRDVKPANVLLDTDDHPWLTDFGIARIVDATRVTATGVVVGTAAYMAPEQVRGEAVGPPADVYALGLVLLEAATGHREYDGGALESALARLHRAPSVPAALPDPLGATLRRMTAPTPGERPTATEVATALRGPAGPRRRSVAGIAGRRAVPVAAFACLVAAALTGALSLAGPERGLDEQRGVVVPAAAPPAPALAVPPAVPDVVEVADAPVPASRPVPVALAKPDPTVRTGVRAAPRATADRSGSADADNRDTDEGRKAQRGGDAGDRAKKSTDDSAADDAGRDRDDANEKADEQKDDEDRDDRGKGGDDGKSGKSGKSGDDGHGRSGSGSDDG